MNYNQTDISNRTDKGVNLESRTAIREFIVDNFMMGREASDLTDGGSLLDLGIIDSTGVLELVGFLEETFSITIEDSELVPENLDSIDNLVAYVARKTE